MTPSEIKECTKKVENLFCPKNENFGGLNADQAREYSRAWKNERADVVKEAIGLFWRADPDFAKRRIAPPPALFAPYIDGTKDRIRRENQSKQQQAIQNPDIPPVVAKYRAFMWRCVAALYTAKRHVEQPRDLIFYSFDNGRLKNSARYRIIDLFILCFVEFGQFAMMWEDYIKEVSQVSPDVAQALADEAVSILRDAEAFKRERYPEFTSETVSDPDPHIDDRSDDYLDRFFEDRDRDPLAEPASYEEIEADQEEEPLF